MSTGTRVLSFVLGAGLMGLGLLGLGLISPGLTWNLIFGVSGGFGSMLAFLDILVDIPVIREIVIGILGTFVVLVVAFVVEIIGVCNGIAPGVSFLATVGVCICVFIIYIVDKVQAQFA